MNLKLIVQYDGTHFLGWQTQPDGRTVQTTLETAIRNVVGHPVQAIASGRTDSGVHAVGQVVSVQADTRLTTFKLLKAINAHLPSDLVVRDVAVVPDAFNANRDAVRKLYRYVIRDHALPDPFLLGRVFHVRYPLDTAAMGRAAQALVGTHDFRCFETEWPNRASSVRTITHLSVNRAGETLWIDVEADGFLYNMVRAIAGTLVNVGRGFWPENRVADILRLGARRLAGPTAPAHGLYLMRVTYPPESLGTADA